MRRRDVFKKIGMMALLVVGLGFINSCTQAEQEPIANTETIHVHKKTDREKLIINRTEGRFVDPENPTKHELKHTPDISIEKLDSAKGTYLVKVIVGQQGIIHPFIKEHWIDFLKVYQNETMVAETQYNNGGVQALGYYVLELNSGDTVTVEAGCNLHGIFKNSVSIK